MSIGPRHLRGTRLAVAAIAAAGLLSACDRGGSEPRTRRTNEREIPTPFGRVLADTDGGVMSNPGYAITLRLRAGTDDGGVANLDGVRYTFTRKGEGEPAATGAAPLQWAPAGGWLEARVVNLFPPEPGARGFGQSFTLGEYDLVAELQSGGRTVATSPPIPLRLEKQEH